MALNIERDIFINVFDDDTNYSREFDSLMKRRKILKETGFQNLEAGGMYSLKSTLNLGVNYVVPMQQITAGKFLHVESDVPIGLIINGVATALQSKHFFSYVGPTDTGNIASLTLVPHATKDATVKVRIVQ